MWYISYTINTIHITASSNKITLNIKAFLMKRISDWIHNIDGLVQERPNTIANALELRLSCTNPLISAEDTNDLSAKLLTFYIFQSSKPHYNEGQFVRSSAKWPLGNLDLILIFWFRINLTDWESDSEFPMV